MKRTTREILELAHEMGYLVEQYHRAFVQVRHQQTGARVRIPQTREGRRPVHRMSKPVWAGVMRLLRKGRDGQ